MAKTDVEKQDLPKECQQFIDECGATEQKNREEAIKDLRFAIAGEQWDKNALANRADLPCLVFNRLPNAVNQIIGDQLQNEMAIKVSPVDSGADPEKAELLEGLIRQIEYSSKAAEAKSQAFKHALISGFPGYLRVLTRHSSDDTFDQELIIRAVPNSFSVYFDPNSMEPDFSDARKCAITGLISKKEFERKYPGKRASSVTTGTGDGGVTTSGEEMVQIAEYFYVEDKVRELLMLADGRVVWRDELDELDLEMIGADPEPPKSRKVESRCVYWSKVSASETLEGPTKLPHKYIPVVPVRAQEVMIENEKYTFGLVRWARDPQAEYNYMRSKNVEVVALAPKAPFLGTKKMFEGLESVWAEANRVVRSWLPFNPDPLMPGSKPERVQPPQSGGSIVADSMQSLEDMKAIMGIPDARMGMKSNEQSGVAIKARRQQSETSTFVYQSNLAIANNQIGRILVDWIPYVYDSERVVRVRGIDGKFEDKTVNQVVGPGMILNDLSTGKYDVTVSVGPSFTTQREESRQFMIEYLGVDPSAAPLIRDLVFKSSDFKDAEEISERFHRTLPPGITGEQVPEAPPAPDPMAANAAVEGEARARRAMAEAEMAELNTHKAHADVAAYAMDQAAGVPPQMPVPARQ